MSHWWWQTDQNCSCVRVKVLLCQGSQSQTFFNVHIFKCKYNQMFVNIGTFYSFWCRDSVDKVLLIGYQEGYPICKKNLTPAFSKDFVRTLQSAYEFRHMCAHKCAVLYLQSGIFCKTKSFSDRHCSLVFCLIE